VGGQPSGCGNPIPRKLHAFGAELAHNSARIVLPQRPNYAALPMVILARQKRPAIPIPLFTTLAITICNCFDAPEQCVQVL
jgi:hypothetical protein